jgi:hypothetical protein
MKHSHNTLIRAIKAELSPDLLSPRYRALAGANKYTGQCYVASEALFHLCGGASSGLVPQVLRHEGSTHWYLKHKESGRIYDLSARQFKTVPPYAQGRGCGFLTREPSKRCRVLLERVNRRIAA